MQTSVRKNYLYNVVYRISSMILPLIVTPYIARVLGVADNGLYAFSSTIACYFILLGKLGLDNYGNRSIAFCRDDLQKRSETFLGIYAMQVMTAAAALLLYAVSVNLFFSAERQIYWIQFLYVLSVVFDVSWFFYGMEMFKLATLRSLLSRGLLIAAVFVFVKDKNDLPVFTFLMALSFLLEQLFLFPFVFKYVKRVRISWKDVWGHVAPNLKLFVPLLALSVYNWMDKIMLGFMVNNDSVAYYNYAESMINFPKGIVIALGTVMLPKLSNMVAKNQIAQSKEALIKSMKLIGFISCALCFGIAAISPTFVPLFLGPRYSPTILLTLELAIVMLPMSVSEVSQSLYLIPFKLESIYIRSVIYGAVVNLLLNLALIPRFAASGAVIATLAAELVVCGYQLYRMRAMYSFRQLVNDFGVFLLCGAVMFGAVFAMNGINLRPIFLVLLQLAAGGVLYLAGCYAALKVFKKSDFLYDIIGSVRRKQG
jgi:O-antigen/teichoic acid export membrane protein